MAANFWKSSHYSQWVLDRQEILAGREEDLSYLSEDEIFKIHMFFANFIRHLGDLLKLRQQVIATAIVYFKRFYSRNSLKSIAPLLLAPTCILLASKAEECGIINSGRFINACTNVGKCLLIFPLEMNVITIIIMLSVVNVGIVTVKQKYSSYFGSDYPYKMSVILECEFFLLELLDCSLIVFHPYRPLLQFVEDFEKKDALLPCAWRAINDSYNTDICLMYPPYIIALACLHTACIIQSIDCTQWFAELSVDLDLLFEVTRQIVALYELLKTYEESAEMKSLLDKIALPKGGRYDGKLMK
ncbi:Cyclin-C [Trichoplax sp. H2]|nr:Cyclin-C [Trichoplax sp. H2]|eukprot:RDD41293.1 Cyclin-C [Trichoplax sp. H2]